MSKRTQKAYVALLRYIEDNICQLEPVAFMTDYETSLRSAIWTVYPGCEPNGCYFHFTQAVRKNARKFPLLFETLNGNPEMHRLYHKMLALPLLPHELILGAFAKLKKGAKTFGKIFLPFLTYFESKASG